MRELKFRAWCTYDKYMATVAELRLDEGRVSDDQQYHDWVIGEDAIVMQYTGLKDKNGKEIYEGDIVKHRSEGIMEVTWGKVGCDYHGGVGFSLADPSELSPSRFEILGNIYENPELLHKEVISK